MLWFRDNKAKVTGLGAVSAVLVTIAIYFGSQLLAGVVIALFGSIRGYNAQQITEMSQQSVGLQFVFVVFTAIFSLYLLRLWLKRRQVSWADIGLSRKPKPSDLGKSAVVFGLYFITTIAVMAIVDAIFPAVDLEQRQQLGFDAAQGIFSLALVFISLVALPPLVEEIMIRGYLYSGLKSRLKPLISAVIASLIFAAAHLQFDSGQPLLWVAAIDTFVLSLFLIGLRENTGSLWSGIFVHFIKNGLAFVSLFIIAAA